MRGVPPHPGLCRQHWWELPLSALVRAAPGDSGSPRQPQSLSAGGAGAQHPRMCLSAAGTQAINHSGCNGSWLQATSMAAPCAPLAKGNRQGTGCWRRCHHTQSVCNAAAWICIKQGQRLDDLIFSFFLAVQQEIAGIVTYLARWPRSRGPRNTEGLAWPGASVLHTEPAGTQGWGLHT